MAHTTLEAGGHSTCLGCTRRDDAWWLSPALTVIVLGGFVVYATWAALQGQHYYAEPYLSPFYSPLLLIKPGVAGGAPASHAWISGWPEWLPAFVTPAFFILVFPGSFRLTCYYYRKAYYRAFAASPPACGVGPRRPGDYAGETRLLRLQNLHRYALYAAVVFVLILTFDAVSAFWRDDRFGVGAGSLVLLLNALLLGGYTFGCHSFRHLVGGGLDRLSAHPLRARLWRGSTWLNERHMQFAWLSLVWVACADLYVRLVSMGVITDLNTWGG